MIAIALLVAPTTSHSREKENFLNKIKGVTVIARKTGDLVVADISKLKETVTIPLSAFTEELQILKLDASDEGLVKETNVTIGEKYILIAGSQSIPFKLFDRTTGKFLTHVGAYGQGPGEYQNVYDMQLDETNDRIYLLPWSAKSILAYNLKGEYISSIPLCFNVPKGRMNIDTRRNRATLVTLPFRGIEAVVWTQTLEGKLIHSTAPQHLTVVPDFSNEVSGGEVAGTFSFNIFTFAPRADSLYHYNPADNRMTPVFTLDFKGQTPSIHGYHETPYHFMGDLSEPKKLSPYLTTTQNHSFYIVDKESLKGAFFRIENDFLGNMEVNWPVFIYNKGYYARNIDPGNLYDSLEKALENKKLPAAMRTKLSKLKDSITDNDNNYILFAKWK